MLFANETYTKSRIVFHTGNGDVVSYLGTPEQPKAAIVYAPGTGKNWPGMRSGWSGSPPPGMHFSLSIHGVMAVKPPAFLSASS